MSDLIDRQDALNSNYRMYDAKSGIEWIPVFHIRDLPSAEPEPKKGKWIVLEDWAGDDYYRCSVCESDFVLVEGTPKDNCYFYCPHCGCRLEWDENA